MKPLRIVEVKHVGEGRCCLCGQPLRGDTIQVGNNMRAHLTCVVHYSFSTSSSRGGSLGVKRRGKE
ncbi:MAG: hypothetical protein QXP57_08540 [Nitrososphaerota archaeon]